MKKLLLLSLLSSGLFIKAALPVRLSKNDRDNLIYLVSEPIKKIEQKIDSINQAANQIQNFIVDNYNQPADHELKEQYHKILTQISHLGLLLEALAYVVQAQAQITQSLGNHIEDLEFAVEALQLELANLQATIGSPSDVSVGEEDFNSVDDIDQAQLSVISLLKTVYREQLHDKFIS